MKNIPIKFRADSVIGEIFGWYVERENKPYILTSGGAYVSVDKDSVTQLVGYDAEGNEVYENDVLQSKLYIEDEGGKCFLMARVCFNRMVRTFMDGYEEKTLNEPIVFNEAIVKDYGFRQVRKGNGNESQTV